MRKTALILSIGLVLFLASCTQKAPTTNQNMNQPTTNQYQNVNQPITEVNQIINQPDNYPKDLVTNKPCLFIQMYSYCSNDEFCFPVIEKCVKWNNEFKIFMEERTKQNPSYEECDQPCKVCQRGKYTSFSFDNSKVLSGQIPSPANEGIKKLEICLECYDSLVDKGYGCIEGYSCILGKCIKK